MTRNKIPHCRDNSKIKSNRAEIDILFPRDFLFVLCFENGNFECNLEQDDGAFLEEVFEDIKGAI
jgi:hypothetical protein